MKKIFVILLAFFLLAPTALADFSPTGGKTYRLRSGIGTTDTTIRLQSLTEPISGIKYTMSYLGSDKNYGTIDPGDPSRSEFISFTGITQNSNGTADLTGVTRGLKRTPAGASCTASSTLASSHSGQAVFIFDSDSPCLFAEYAVKQNDETISGNWSIPEPSASTNPATKNYVDTHVNGGAVTVTGLVPSATAGETVAAGNLLFASVGDGRWYKASASTTAITTAPLGIAQGSGTSGGAISGGVLVFGLDSNQSGLTTGAMYFASTATGTIAAATSTRAVGVAKSATTLYFDPHLRTGTTQTRWIKLKETTLAAASSSVGVTNIPDLSNLRVVVNILGKSAVGQVAIRFNNDTTGKYASRYSLNGAADVTAVNAASTTIEATNNTSGVGATVDIENASFASGSSFFTAQATNWGSDATPGTIPTRQETGGKYNGAAAYTNQIDVYHSGGGTFDAGSTLTVYGEAPFY